jgi:hypothetical protein
MTAVETPLPLFTAEAEQAAQGADIDCGGPAATRSSTQLEKCARRRRRAAVQRVARSSPWNAGPAAARRWEWATQLKAASNRCPDCVAEAATAPADAAAEDLFTSEGAPAIEDAATTTA